MCAHECAARVTGSCKLPDVGAGESNSGPQEEQYVPLTTQPALQPLLILFLASEARGVWLVD